MPATAQQVRQAIEDYANWFVEAFTRYDGSADHEAQTMEKAKEKIYKTEQHFARKQNAARFCRSFMRMNRQQTN